MRLVLPRLLPAFCLPLALATSLRAQSQSNPNYGEQSHVEVEVRRWRSDLVSELRISGVGVPGSDLTPDILGLPAERTWDYRGSVRLARRLKIRGSWFLVKYEADTQPGSALAIGGLVVPPGAPLTTRLELEDLRVGAEFDVLTGEYGYLAVVGEYARFDARTAFASSGEERSPEYRIQLPLFGLKGRVYLTPALALTVEGVGMKRESQGVMTEFEAAASYSLIPNLAVSYGYRNSYNRVSPVESFGDRALFRLRGQYFAVTVRF